MNGLHDNLFYRHFLDKRMATIGRMLAYYYFTKILSRGGEREK
jgi:hypothetical protein